MIIFVQQLIIQETLKLTLENVLYKRAYLLREIRVLKVKYVMMYYLSVI